MADWQGSTPGDTPGYGNTGPGQAWDANRREPNRDANPAPWPQQSPPAPQQGAQQAAQPWPPTPQSPPSYQQQQPQYQQPQYQQPQYQQQHASPNVRDTVEQAKDRAVHLAGDAREQVTQRVESGLDRGKARAADTLGGVAQTLLQSSQQLRQQQPQLGDYAERAAREMQRFSDYLQRTDVHELVGRAEDVARRQPALFLGGMFALGLVGARFLRSSSRAQQPGTSQYHGPSLPSPQASQASQAGLGDRAFGASPSSSAYAADYGATSGYGATGYGAPQRVYGGYGSTQPPYDAAGTLPLDRDVTDRQQVASEPTYGTGTPALGEETYRRRESAWDLTPDERTQPGGVPRPTDPDYRTGGYDPRGGEQP